MKKNLLYLLTIIISIIVACIYGIINDHITYSISPEYYTKFKFIQFGLADNNSNAQNARALVTLTGIIATWWMGLLIGIVLGITAFSTKSNSHFFKIVISSIFVAVIITFITGIIGLLYGYIFINIEPENWYIPNNLIKPADFIAVGSMHNFSYAGGIFGLMGAIIYIIVKKKQFKYGDRIKEL